LQYYIFFFKYKSTVILNRLLARWPLLYFLFVAWRKCRHQPLVYPILTSENIIQQRLGSFWWSTFFSSLLQLGEHKLPIFDCLSQNLFFFQSNVVSLRIQLCLVASATRVEEWMPPPNNTGYLSTQSRLSFKNI